WYGHNHPSREAIPRATGWLARGRHSGRASLPGTSRPSWPALLLGEGLLARLRVPHPHRPVLARRGEAAAGGAEADAASGAGLPLEGEGLLAGLRVPDLHRPVNARRGDPHAVAAEAHAPDGAGVPLEGEGLLGGLRVPDPHRPVIARRGDPLAVAAEADA